MFGWLLINVAIRINGGPDLGNDLSAEKVRCVLAPKTGPVYLQSLESIIDIIHTSFRTSLNLDQEQYTKRRFISSTPNQLRAIDELRLQQNSVQNEQNLQKNGRPA